MKLTKLQGRRFFRMFDPLTLYANERLDVVDPGELSNGTLRGIDDQAQAEVARELWQNLDVIDDFVRENPAGLSDGELDTVASWRRGLTRHYVICRQPDGVARFVGSGYAFEVSGISREIEDMVGEPPVFVYTTLLPFDGRILYSEYLVSYPVGFGQNMLDIIEQNSREIFDSGRIVSSAGEFLAVADDIRAKELDEDINDMLADLEELERESAGHGAAGTASQASSTLPGFGNGSEDLSESYADDLDASHAELSDEIYRQHRGVLAGLSEEERRRELDAHFEEIRTEMGNALVSKLKRACGPGPLEHSLSALLARETKAQLLEAAEMFGVSGVSHMRKADLVARLVEELPQAFNVEIMLSVLGLSSLQTLRKLVDDGGVMSVPEEDVTTLAGLPQPMLILCYVFYDDGMFTFIVPDEMIEAVRDADWEHLVFEAERYEKLLRIGNALVGLRGAVPIADVGDETFRLYPDLYDNMIDLVDDLLGAVSMGVSNFRLVDDGEEMYLLHFELAWERDYDLGREPSIELDLRESIIEDGPLGQTVSGLLAAQQGTQPRPLEHEMLSYRDVYEWKCAQPVALALRRYFDAHVPDTANDYYFSDKVMEDLLEEYKWGEMEGTLERQFQILEDNGFIPEKSDLQTLLSLLMNCANGLPVWPNNGWAPQDLFEEETGRRLFLNEDGLPMKIGRNDPCPCGSGKKYKKCCGR